MDTPSSWTGTIQVRLLPEWVSGDYEVKKPSAARRNSFSTSDSPVCRYQKLKATSGAEDMIMDSSIEQDCSIVALDINMSSMDSSDNIYLHLNRTPEETLDKTLQRLGLSLAKKLLKKKKYCKEALVVDYQLGFRQQAAVQQCGPQVKLWPKIETIQLILDKAVSLDLQIDVMPPTVVSVQAFEAFGSCLFVGIPLVVTIETLYCTKATMDWYVGTNCVCYESKSYTPREEDVGESIVVVITPQRNHVRGQVEAYQFRQTVQIRPRNAILDLRPEFVQPRRQDNGPLRVLSYNILADLNAFSTLAQESFYTYCDNAFLVKERRLPLVLHEILQYQADIICLQEVDSSIFRELLKPVLEHRNYQGFYAPKEGTREGGAMFWSLQAFERVNDNDHKKFVIRTLFDTENCLNDWTSMRDIGLLLGQHKELSLLVREKLGHVLQRVTLTSKASQKQLVAANTHLFFHPMASHIRLLQMYACLHELARQENPIVFCGDFNSSPTSGAARLVFDGIVEPSAGVTDMGATWKHLNTLTWGDGESSPSQLSVEAIQPPTISLPKSFPRLCSGYPELPKTTHHIQSFSATLDYILVSQQDFGSVSWAVIPSEDVLTEHVAMPSEVLPSDHVCLVCDLAWS